MNDAGSKFRKLIAVAIFLITLLLLLFVFSATQSALDVWDRLQQLPAPLFYTYSVLILSGLLFSFYLVYKLLKPSQPLSQSARNEVVTEEGILTELDNAEESGMLTSDLRREIEHLQERKKAGTVYIALFGDVSTGKSSIIKSLLPDAELEINVKGGSTQEIHQYTWQSSSGDQLVLTDLPGRNEAEGALDLLVKEEAIRSQIVIYVTDSDLSRSQFDDIKELQSYGKPLIVALNKSDRFNDKEKQLLKDRFSNIFGVATSGIEDLPSNQTNLVFIQSGGEEEVLKIYPDGKEQTVMRERHADISSLSEALQKEIDLQGDLLESLRDASVFVLVKQKLDTAKDDFREEKAEEIIKSSTKKAVVGALAALSPGSDLVIQGVLGTQMVKSLCALYDVPVRQLDIDKLLDFSGNQMKKSTPLLLAVAGNGMKAFPGIGTVTGGLTHAVAYGLIFDALGHAVNKTLKQRGSLPAAPAAITFREMLSEDLEVRAKLFAKLVFDKQKSG